ncbi:unnamed protein product [Aspergillus oryzae]|nr:unnamed protein product [Aspergillus oryzae]
MLNVTSPWALILSLLTAIVSISYYNNNPSAPEIRSPHCASWNAWYNPLRSGQVGYQANDWNILYHLGGNGPWIEKIDELETPGLEPPKGCVIDQHFASGFFGLDWAKTEKAALEIIPETLERGADTLTPGDTCPKYIEDPAKGHDNGVNMLALFQDVYIPAIAERLINDENNSALGYLTNLEVYGMQEMCGFETLSRGSSPWCDIFTHDDWENFEYARDLIHYYRAGPGNPYAGAMGWLWLNATTGLLRSGPEAGTIVHDGDIAPLVTAMDILKDPKYDPFLPTTHRVEDRVWRTSSVMPMGGRIVFERLTCPTSSAKDPSGEEAFLRVNINDKIVPLPYCKSGPGLSCPLKEFVDHVERRRSEVGDFGEVCGLEKDVGYITFLRQG